MARKKTRKKAASGSRSKKPLIVNAKKVKARKMKGGDRYAFRAVPLGQAAGGRQIGCSLYELPPGKRSYPYHYHTANEEAIYVLEGQGTIRLPGGRKPLRPGDYVALPADRSGAHQVINSSSQPLRYLCISTMTAPEVGIYPDSGKIGFFAEVAPGDSRLPRTLYGFHELDAGVDYFKGEL